MPKKKPSQASANFFAHAYALGEQNKATLLSILRFEAKQLRDAEYPEYHKVQSPPGAPLRLQKNPDYVAPAIDPYAAIRAVEVALGLYIEGAMHIDNVPRPADYRDTFRPIGRNAFELLDSVGSLTDYYRGQFTLRGKDIYAIERALGELVEMSAAVVKEMSGQSSKGAPKNAALCEVIRRIRKTFQDYYQGKRDSRRVQGAFQARASWEKDEAAFIEHALSAAGIVRKPFRELERMLRDPRCALIEDRPTTVARIARKVERERLREQKGNLK